MPKRHYKQVYDSKDTFNPDDAKWYNLKLLERRHLDLEGKIRKSAVKHLEWQLLGRFIKGDADKPAEGQTKARCSHFHVFFKREVKIDNEIKVRSDGGDEEDREAKRDEEKAIDWVVYQFSGKKTKPMNWLFGKGFEPDERRKKSKRHKKNDGKLRTIARFRDMVGVYKYHQLPRIKEIMISQAKRIGYAFEYFETEVVPKIEFKHGSDKK
ncbi:hypothetical protein K469DRAFT_749511 [Zopfia rhizophila CBS 207.26]|uniref:Uncharacterized protein n=1 Tax=Zopfia rhizophila CBS 207.26 TaxID=1314779 RepID=A0A6A6E5D9_9PEZI|nr:hypothetical protein K469DRAFT_749511 [Zopfia rhizophila CBS 207.26]